MRFPLHRDQPESIRLELKGKDKLRESNESKQEDSKVVKKS